MFRAVKTWIPMLFLGAMFNFEVKLDGWVGGPLDLRWVGVDAGL